MAVKNLQLASPGLGDGAKFDMRLFACPRSVPHSGDVREGGFDADIAALCGVGFSPPST